MNDSQTITIKKRDMKIMEAFVWLNDIPELTPPHPGELQTVDFWTATKDDTIIGLAAIHPGREEITRLGVDPDHRNQGIGSKLLNQLTNTYGELELTCRRSLDANDFYDHIGWEKDGVRIGEPEDLIIWTNKPLNN